MREQRQAECLKYVEKYAEARRQARHMERNALTELRHAVVASINEGVTMRRIQELSGLSLATINKWNNMTQEEWSKEDGCLLTHVENTEGLS